MKWFVRKENFAYKAWYAYLFEGNKAILSKSFDTKEEAVNFVNDIQAASIEFP